MRARKIQAFFGSIKSQLVHTFWLFFALCKQALKAIATPHTAFRNLPESITLRYRWMFFWLGLSGAVFVFLHFTIAQGRWLMQYPYTDLVHIIFMPPFSIWIWLSGSLLFYGIAHALKKEVNFRQIEVASFYIWMVWFLMPVFDLPHLLFGLPFVTIYGAGAHISWLFAFLWMPLLSYFLMRDVIGLQGRLVRVGAIGVAAAIPIVGRYGVEQLPAYAAAILNHFGFAFNYNSASFVAAVVMITVVLSAWVAIVREVNVWRLVPRYALVSSICMLLLGSFTLNLARYLDDSGIPERLGRQIKSSEPAQVVGNFGKGLSQHTNSFTWIGGDYESGTQGLNSTEDGANTSLSQVIATYTDVVDLDFDPSHATITAARCRVNFTSDTRNHNADGNDRPQARCDIQPDGGSWQTGNFIGPLDGASTQIWHWNNPSWGNQLSQSNNSVRIYGETQHNGNNNSADGDTLFYDAVFVEIDYIANMTQTTYRWYDNADSIQPGSPRADENTAASVEHNEVIRLRTGLELDTGSMDQGTEAFKLQYTEMDAASCSESSNWNDVGDIDSPEPWRGYSNSSVSNGAQIDSALLGGHNYALQTYQEDNTAFNNPTEQNPGTQRGEWDWVVQNNSTPVNTPYCFRVVREDGNTLSAYDAYAEITTADATSFNQAAYRWFTNTDDLEAGSPLEQQDEPADAPGEGSPFRLRMLLDIEGQTLPAGAQGKLQYAITTEPCSADFSELTFNDVTPGSGAIRFYDNPSLTDGDMPAPNPADPQFQNHPVIYQQYVEANNFSNPNSIPAGSSGLWDFSLVDHSANPDEQYCFRIVDIEDNPINAYDSVPEITTVGGLNIAIVDQDNNSVGSPGISLSPTVVLTECQTTTGTLGTPAQRLRITNNLVKEGWGVNIAATDGPTALWSAGTPKYDFNDPAGSPPGCAAGSDSDVYAGQMTVDPSAINVEPSDGCNNIGLSTTPASSFAEGSEDIISLLSASSSSQRFCSFFVENIGIEQTIPPEQQSGVYSIDMTLTIVAH